MYRILAPKKLRALCTKFFRLPTRTIAKNFLYRMIFIDVFGPRGLDAAGYAYANDPDYTHVSTSKSYWMNVAGRFFEKYPVIYNHSRQCVQTAMETGQLTTPSGRFFPFKQYMKKNGEPEWPRANMLNYPVQSLAADFMTLARKIAWRLIGKREDALFVSTVHDDIEMDLDNDPVLCYNISMELEKCFTLVPTEFQQVYGASINVPLAGEVKLGWTLYEEDMVKFNSKDFEPIWESVLTKRPDSLSQ